MFHVESSKIKMVLYKNIAGADVTRRLEHDFLDLLKNQSAGQSETSRFFRAF